MKRQFGGTLRKYATCEQWAIGAIDRASDSLILAMLPGGGRTNINAITVSDIFVGSTARRHTLIATDSARYYNVRRTALRWLRLSHVKVNHRLHQRVVSGLRSVGGRKVGTQRCVCVCVCVCVRMHAHTCQSIKNCVCHQKIVSVF